MNNNLNLNTWLLSTSQSTLSYDLMDNNYIEKLGNNIITTASIDLESYNTFSQKIKAITIDLGFITPTSLLDSPISIQISQTYSTKETQIYLKKEHDIFTLTASTGQSIMIGADLGKKSPLKADKFGKFADLEYIFLYFILRLAGKQVNSYSKDDRINQAINSYQKSTWKN